jgi:hypothetical protein
MADNETRIPLACVDEVLLAAQQDDPQLEFAFAAVDACRAQHDRARPRPRLGRGLPAPRLDRPLEEMHLEHGISCHLPPGKILDLRLTDNRYTIISVRRGRECYRARVHRMFAGAEPRLLRALARYIVHNDQRASALLSEFIEGNQDKIKRQPPRERREVLRTRGRVHDLSAVLDRLNHRHFGGNLDLRITWGSACRRPSQRSIKIGAYLVEDRLIRVHPVLDQELVPRFFVEWIVFHEMLHGKHAIRQVGGRRCFHPPEFAREEKQFPEYERARQWEKANLDRLLSWQPRKD